MQEINEFDEKNIVGKLKLLGRKNIFKPDNDIEKNYWFSSANVEKDIENITKKASELGLAFVDVRPRIRKEKNNKRNK